KFVQGNEIRAFDVPVRLLGLRLQVDGVGQARVEQLDCLHANSLRQVVLGLEHLKSPLKKPDAGSLMLAREIRVILVDDQRGVTRTCTLPQTRGAASVDRACWYRHTRGCTGNWI